MTGFLFGGNTGETYASLQAKRELAEAMLAQQRAPRNVGEGIHAIGQAIGGRMRQNSANEGIAKGQAGAQKQFSGLFSGPSPSVASIQRSAPVDIPGSAANADTGGLFAPTPASPPANAPVVNLSGSRRKFVEALLPAAIEEGKRTGVDPRIIVAQAAQETGWGRSAPGNNYFGIKSHGKGGGQEFTTHEVINGRRVKIRDNFRRYNSPGESVRGYGDFLLKNPRYRKFMGAQGLDNQLAALQASGYATDPNYSRSVGAIARGIQLPPTATAYAPTDVSPAQQAIQQVAQGPSMTDVPMDVPTFASLPGFGESGDPNGEQVSLPPKPTNVEVPQQLAQNTQADTAKIMEAMANPFMSAPQRRMLSMLLQQRMQQNDPLRQLQMQKLQGEINAPAKRQIIKGVDGRNYYTDTQEPVIPGAQPRPDTPPALQQNYELARSQGYTGSFLDYQTAIKKAGSNNTTVNVGGNGQSVPGLSKLGEGMTYLYNPDGTIKFDERGVPMSAPITGTKKANEEARAAEQKIEQQNLRERSGNVVTQDIDRAIDIIDNSGLIGGTGLGSYLRDIPNTDAHRLSQMLATVKSNAGFDKLQSMREASPTGGALGQVSERELSFLQSAIGSLEQSQDDQDLKDNLNRVWNIYQDIIHGKGNGPKRRTLSFEKPVSADDKAGDDMKRRLDGAAGQKRLKFNPATGKAE